MGRGSMLNQSRINAVEYEMTLVDAEISKLYELGYQIDVDRLLDRRVELQQRKWALSVGLIPNG